MTEPRIGVFSVATANRILDQLREQKREIAHLRQEVSILRGAHNYDVPRNHVAYTTSTITARSGDDWGIGTATLKYCPGVPGVDVTSSDYAGGAEIDVHNITSSEVDSGKWIYVNREHGSGRWVVTVEDCGG